MQSYVINLIRHGMTQANVEGKYAGWWDIPVNDEGKEKLKNLKENYKYPQAAEVYSSPLQRCVQTCNIIYPEAKPIIAPGLKECNFGAWEGKTSAQLADDEQYQAWVAANRQTAPPEGENGKEFFTRVCTAFEGIVESMMRRKSTSATIFTHGGVIMLLLSTYGIPRTQFFDWIVDNGCGYSVRITPGLWMRDKVFEVFEKLPTGASGEISGKFKDLMDTLHANSE